MKYTSKHLLILVFFLFPIAAYSQGSGSSSPRREPEKKEKNFTVTRTVNGVVDSVDGSSVLITYAKSKKITLNITSSTKVSEVCLETGKKVKATYTPKDRNATAIQCK